MKAQTASSFQIFLFAPIPRLRWQGKLFSIGRRDVLNLLLYLLVEGQTEYEREKLIMLLYGNLNPASATDFRQILAKLNKIFRAYIADEPILVGQETLKFQRQLFWLDTEEFSTGAKSLFKQQAESLSYEESEASKAILALYQSDFLPDYDFHSKNDLRPWHQKWYQEYLADYHRLLEQLIRFQISQANFAEAQSYAELWSKSSEAGAMPLQYRIWLALKRQEYVSLQRLLTRLEKEERQSPHVFGLKAAEWQEFIQKSESPSLALLQLRSKNPMAALTQQSQAFFLNTETRLTALIELIASPQAPQVIGLTGLAGSGKSRLAEQVRDYYAEIDKSRFVTWLKLSPTSDYEFILNEVLTQLNLQRFISLPYDDKRQRFKSYIDTHPCLIILDEGASEKFKDPIFLETISQLFEQVQLLLIARELEEYDYQPFEVFGEDSASIRQILLGQFPDLSISPEELAALSQITGGLLLVLNWLVGYLKSPAKQLSGFITALSQLQDAEWTRANATERYAYIVKFLWNGLDANAQTILYIVSMFDPMQGVGLENLDAVAHAAANMTKPELLKKLKALQELRMLEEQRLADGKLRYTLHPIIYRQTQSQISASLGQLQKHYIRHFYDFARKDPQNFERLDQNRQNIVGMFEMHFSPDYPEKNQELVYLLNQLYGYFERSGLYTKTESFLQAALKLPSLADEAKVSLLHNLGQAAFKQGQLSSALGYFNEAWELAQAIQLKPMYSPVLRDLGRIYLHWSKLAEAKDYFQKGIDHAEALFPYGQIMANLAVIAQRESDYLGSKKILMELTAFLQAHEAEFTSPHEHLSLLQFIENSLGYIALEEQDYPQADKYLTSSLELSRRINNPERMATVYLNLGVLSYYRAKFKAAYDYFTQGELVAEYIQNTELNIWFTWNKGAINTIQQNFVDARQKLWLALGQAQSLNYNGMIPFIYLWFGILHYYQNDKATAKRYFLEIFDLSALNAKYGALALFALALLCREEHLPHKGGLEAAQSEIAAYLDATGPDCANLRSLVTREELGRALNYFQIAIRSIPNLKDFYIVESLIAWLDLKGEQPF